MLGAVKLTKRSGIDEYKHSGYGIGSDKTFSVGNGSSQNVIIFGADMSSFLHAFKKKKNILIIGEDITKGLDGATLTTEKMYSVHFTENNKKIA